MTNSVPTATFSGPCPVGRLQSAPCPRKDGGSCSACLCDWAERAALGEFFAHMSREKAEAAATEQLRAELAKSTPKQRELFG